MPASRRAPFLIVGGGIGGLITAYALACRNFPVIVLERAAEFREIGGGIQLGPNVFRALDRLGLKNEVLLDAWQPGKLEMRDALTGQVIALMPLGERFLQHFDYPYAVTHRADLHSVYLDACQATGMVSLETNSRVIDFEQSARGVTLWLEDGRTFEGDALIGCDGLWSRVREKLVNDGDPRLSGHIAYRAVLKRADIPPELWRPDVVLWAGPHSTLIHYPLRRGTLYNVVAVFQSHRYVEGWNTPADREELWKHFAGQRPEVMRLLEVIEAWRMWVLCDREPIKSWSHGRATLLGDAAHPMLQYLAQGACMATEDALTLAEKAAETPDDIPGAFGAYQDARYLRTGRAQLTARLCGQIYHAEGVAAELRYELLHRRTAEEIYQLASWLYSDRSLAHSR